MLRRMRMEKRTKSCGRRPWMAIVLASLVLACDPDSPAEPNPEPLRIALHGDPSGLDPHLQMEVIAQSVLGNIYEKLVAFDVNMGLVPSLAERWENPDDLTLRLHLRDGVEFHDGRPFSAADVVYSFERARHHPDSKCSAVLGAVEEIRVVDPLTIELRTATHYPILLNKLAFFYIVPEGAPDAIRRPIGTGPYRFLGFEEDGRLSLEAFARHWRGPPAAGSVEFSFLNDPQERLRRLLAGELDLIEELAPQDVDIIRERPGFRVESRSGLMVSFLEMDTGIEPFSDPRFRQAVDLALDREALVAEALLGQGQPLSQMVSPNVFGYAPQIAVVEQDAEKARLLLAEAGYADGLDLRLEYRAGRSPAIDPIREQLAAVGIRIEPVPRPWSEMYTRLNSGKVPFYFGGWTNTSGDASDLLDYKVHTRVALRGYGASNFNRYSHPEIDSLIERSATMKMEQRGEILQQALMLLADDRANIPLYTLYELYGVREEIAWVPRLDGRVYAFEIER
ncbi:MAG: hypothetical protein GY856_46160 [bacterium]|nr:hypothetical protein [bacterium]